MTLYIQPYPFRRMARYTTTQPQPKPQTLAVNIQEEEEAYLLYALVPGLKAEDLNIQVLENIVSIEGEYKAEEHNALLVHELPRGNFRRSLRMPTEINAEKVEARIADGVLTLVLPKAASARPKKIQVTIK